MTLIITNPILSLLDSMGFHFQFLSLSQKFFERSFLNLFLDQLNSFSEVIIGLADGLHDFNEDPDSPRGFYLTRFSHVV